MVKIVVSGAAGRMGTRIKKIIEDDRDAALGAGFDINDDPAAAIEKGDVLIDFTAPDATLKNVGIAAKLGKGVVIGTTGIDEAGAAAIKAASKKIPIVFSPNMAVGVNVLFKLVGDASKALGREFAASISETHHVHKKDAPSGTAKMIHRIACEARGAASEDINVESKRVGEVVGDHSIIFDSAEETIEIRHHAKSRDVFARGAVVAAKFLAGKKKGLYGMNEVLGIDK